MNHEERIRRAEKAKELLENEYMQACFSDIKEALVSSIETCKWTDTVTQNNLMLSLQLLKNMKKIMEKHIVDGKVAQKEVMKMNKPSRFKVA